MKALVHGLHIARQVGALPPDRLLHWVTGAVEGDRSGGRA
jgi:hypothetical protein